MRRLIPALVASLLFTARAAQAHGFGQRFDLPLPLYLWVWGAGLTIVLSFVVMALFVREGHAGGSYPRFDLSRLPLIGWLSSRLAIAIVRAVVASVFVVTIAAGYFGKQESFSNLIVPMVWVAWWVGFAFEIGRAHV